MRIQADSVATLFGERPEVWHWPHVDAAREWACKGTGQIVIETTFLDLLELLRSRCGFPLPITSGYRSPAHNARVSTSGTTGPHTTGRAADIAMYGLRAHTLVHRALQLGFTGIGLRQTGPHGARFVHVDNLPDAAGQPRPWIWTY